MALERPPKYLALNPEGIKRYRPPESEVMTWHTVGFSGKESWYTLEKQYGVPAERIIAFNFPGAVEDGVVVPEIVNWYLRYHVGFGCPETHDRKNRRFKGGERVAIPYLGKVEIGEPEIVRRLTTPSNIWFGGGFKSGTTFGVVGIETSQIVCFSVDDPAKGFSATISGSRFPALGIGASGGAFIVLITSMQDPAELSHLMTGSHGYSFRAGVGIISGLAGKGAVKQAVKVLGSIAWKYGRMGVAAARYGTEVAKYHTQIVDLVRMLGMNLNAAEPQVLTLAIPKADFGVEIGYQFVVSEYHVVARW